MSSSFWSERSYWYNNKRCGFAWLLACSLVVWSPALALAASDGDDDAGMSQGEEQSSQGDEGASSQGEMEDSGQSGEVQANEELSFFSTSTVTATGTKIETFNIPTPVIVIDATEIEEQAPNNAADLLRNEPGVDVNGIGPNQVRPIIRGQRGLRVLFLENGLRLNNARRQTDFGEITGLVDIDDVQTLEVVRGPASVLYGTDAIGGVLNMITKVPAYRDGTHVEGSVGLRHSSADDQNKYRVSLRGNADRFTWGLGYTHRDADEYEAPSGTFGDITLDDDTKVIDTGITDKNYSGYLGWRFDDRRSLSFRYTGYRADQTGFGFVEPDVIGDTSGFRIRILYPFQDFDRYNLGFESQGMQNPVASTANIKLYHQQNKRQLANDIFINIGPAFGPGTGPDGDVTADTLNYTNLKTDGFRAELTKIIGDRQLLTYGAEYFADDSFNTDHSVTTTTLRAFFPISFVCGPQGAVPFPFECVFEETDDVANAPNAENNGTGVFVQDEVAFDRLTVIAGARWARSETKAKATPGWDITGLDFSDDDVVGAVNLTFNATDHLNVVGSYGTAFRAPNIIERLFNGLTPEGAGYQVLNPDLTSETSENFDIGLKYLSPHGFFDITYFENDISDAIVQHTLTPEERAALPLDVQEEIDVSGVEFVVQQRNADKLKIDGVEIAGGYRWHMGLSIGGNFTDISGKSVEGGPASNPTGDTFDRKINGYVRYDRPSGRWWASYDVRHQGEKDVALDPSEAAGPLGEVLPSFTVHSLSGGVQLFRGSRIAHNLGVVINNLTDELYAEFSNATFFRPQPKRNVIVTYGLSFF